MFLKKNERMSIQELEIVCHREGKKVSNGERRLREMQDDKHHSYCPRVSVRKNEKGAIIAYTYIPSEYEIMDRKIRSGELSEAKLQSSLL